MGRIGARALGKIKQEKADRPANRSKRTTYCWSPDRVPDRGVTGDPTGTGAGDACADPCADVAAAVEPVVASQEPAAGNDEGPRQGLTAKHGRPPDDGYDSGFFTVAPSATVVVRRRRRRRHYRPIA